MHGAFHYPAHNHRRDAFAVAHYLVERLLRESAYKCHPLVEVGQLGEERLYYGKHLLVLGRRHSVGDYLVVAFGNTFHLVAKRRVASGSELSCRNELVGQPSEGRHHNHGRLRQSLYYLFYVRQTLGRPDRCAAKFQYFHSFLPSECGTERPPARLGLEKRAVEKHRFLLQRIWICKDNCFAR